MVLLVDSGVLDQAIEQSSFLFMDRADKLGQAISRVMAEQNQRWASHTLSDFPDDQLVYSANRLAWNVYGITEQNLAFQQFFALNGILPVNVLYERLVRDPQAELNSITRELALPDLRFDPGKLRFERQANETNQAWRSRFLQEDKFPRTGAFRPAQMPIERAEAAQLEAVVVAHFQNVGDKLGASGSWLGASGGRWIEGFSILTQRDLLPNDVEYCGVDDSGRALPSASSGTFSGTRGRAMPLRGFCVRLRGVAATRYQCTYSGRFRDGSTIGPVQAGFVCQSPSLAPLEALQIIFRASTQ
jgi:hypothetical protein